MPVVEPLENRRVLATLVVNSTLDNFNPSAPATDGAITLREAILAANSDTAVGDAPAGSGADTISFDPAVFGESREIDLTGSELPITSSLTIVGPGINLLDIDADDSSRVFNVDDGLPGQIVVTIQGLEIEDGQVSGEDGGGILNRESLTLDQVKVRSNSALGGNGSGIANLDGTLTVRDSEIRSNDGGSTAKNGGGIYSTGPLTITGSVIAGNGLLNSGPTSGGGVFSSGGAVIRHSTIAGNNATTQLGGGGTGQGGGIFATGVLTLDHVVVADNTASGDPEFLAIPDIAGAVTSTYSLIEDTTGTTITDNGGTITGIDPQLDGNRTPGSRSILVNSGDPNAVAGQGNVPTNDLDGNARIQSGRIDIGAVETAFADPGFFVVNSTEDLPVNLNDNVVTLRDALATADLVSGHDTITFDSAVFGERQEIDLTGSELPIRSSVTIVGPGINLLDINANNSSRVFNVDDGLPSQIVVTIQGLEIENGQVTGEDGGGILNRENLTLDQVKVRSNSSDGGNGSGIANLGGTLTVRDSEIRNNADYSSAQNGGGIYSTGPLTITGSVIAGNRLGNSNSVLGGGIYSSGGAVIRHSTIAGNSVTTDEGSADAQGGGIFAINALILDHVVVADNTATGDPARINIPDIAGAVTSSYSLIEDTTGATITDNGGTITGIDPQLTNNRTPAANSILVNAGDPAAIAGQGNVPLTDFEGNPRLQQSRIDIGAVEVQFPPTLLSFTRQTPSDEITNADTLVFTAIFDEAVTNLDGSDFDVTGTTATVTGVTEVSPTEFTLTVSGGDLATVSAVVGLNLNSNQDIADLGGTALGNSEPAVDETYSLDNAGPTLTDFRPDNQPVNPVSWPGHITVQATDPNGVASVEIGIRNLGAARFWDGTAFASEAAVYFPATQIPGTNDWRIPFDESNLSTQNHRFWIQATDNLGNQITGEMGRGPIFFYDQTITVDTLTDVSNGDFSAGDLSLREALEQIATLSGGPYTIRFAQGLSGQTLNLTGGPWTISGDVTIDGDVNNDGRPDITINAGNGTDGLPRTYDGNRIFTIDDGDSSKSSSVTIDGLTLMGGDSGAFGGGSAGASGGAIFNSENLTVKNSVLKDNATRANGGAIFSSPSAAVTVIDSAFTGNFANNAGGAIYVDSFGTGEIRNSLIAQNSSANVGAGLLNLGNLGIVNSTFSANTTSSSGGAVSNGGHLNVGHSTFAQNVAASGGTDIGGLGLTDSANLSHSIFTGTVDGQNTVTGDYNLFANTVTIAGSNNLMNTDPKLGPLQDNGGLTQTHAPMVDSPAIGGGDFLLMSGVSIVPVNDQRGPGFDRIVDVIDIGAFEDVAPFVLSFTRQTPMSELTNADSLVFRVIFSEDVQQVGRRAFSVDGSINTRFAGIEQIDARTYDIRFAGDDLANGNGVVGINLAAASTVFDMAFNQLRQIEPPIDETYTVENTAPVLNSLSRQSPIVESTNASTLVFRATFDEDVFNVDASDFSVNGSTTATITNVTPIDARTYDIEVSGGDLENFVGTVGLDVAGGNNILDAFGNGLPGLEPSTDQTYQVDTIDPKVQSISRLTPGNQDTNADTLVFRVLFDESVLAVHAPDFLVAGTNPLTTATVTDVETIDRRTYNVTVSGGDLASYNGNVGLSLANDNDVTDFVGNLLDDAPPSVNESYRVDNANPTLNSFRRLTPGSELTNATTLVFQATFDEDVFGVDSTDFLLDSNSTATITDVSAVDARTYNITVSGGDLSSFVGTVGLNVAGANNILDLVGNAFPGSEPATDEFYRVDTIAPVLLAFARQTPSGEFTNADTLVIRATFDEDVSGVDASDFVIAGSSPMTTATVSNVASVDGRTYDITISGGDLASYNGSVGLNVANGLSITDLAGNALPGSEPGTDQSYTVDNLAPTLSLTRQAPVGQFTNADSLVFRASFDEDVFGVDATDFQVSGKSNSPVTTATITNVTSVDARTYDITVSGGDLSDFNGVVGLDIADSNDVADQLGNTAVVGEPSIDETYTVDNIAPRMESFMRHNPTDLHTDADSLVFRAVFDEDVVDVEIDDFFIANISVTPKTTATITNLTAVDSRTYDLTVSGGDLATYVGILTLDVTFSFSEPTFVDLAGNGASTGRTSEPYFVNLTTAEFARQSPASIITNADTLIFRATFSQDVTNVDVSDFIVLPNSNGPDTTARVTSVTRVDGKIYDLTVSGGDLADFNGRVSVSFIDSHDIVGASGADSLVWFGSQSYTVDNVAPTLVSFTRETPADEFTNEDSLVFQAELSGNPRNIDASDFVVTGGTTATITGFALDQDAADTNVSYDITISGGDLATFNGVIGIDISDSNDIADDAGNPLVPGGPAIDETYTVDNIAPQVASIGYGDGTPQRSVIRSVTVDFDSEVILDADAFSLTTKDGTAVVLSAPALSVVDGKTRAVLTFSGEQVDESGSLNDGNYRLTVQSSKIRDLAGNSFDGDRDGVVGGDAVDDFFRLFGDTDGDRDVDGQDYGRMARAFLKSQGQEGYSPLFDFDGDGDVDGQDYGQFASRLFTTLDP